MLTRVRLAILAGLCIILAGCGGGGSNAGPDVYAVTTTNVLIKFGLRRPNQVDTSVAITGLQGGETILGIDFRPADGLLYGLGSTGRLYTINLVSGAATQVGSGTFVVPLNGAHFGFDINPVTDQARVVSDAEQNMRIDLTTGAVIDGDLITPGVQPDTNLAPPGDTVGLAYTNNFVGAAVTTAFTIDSTTDSLLMLGGVDGNPSPNLGALTVVGLLGFDLKADAELDVDSHGTAVIVNNTGVGANDVYTVNLLTGATNFEGTVNTGGSLVATAIRG